MPRGFRSRLRVRELNDRPRRDRAAARELIQDLVDVCGEVEVEGRQSTLIVSRDFDLDAVVHVGPIGMVLEPLGDQRDLSHEAERFDERPEFQLPPQCAADLLPAR